jgi:hypothetical protein
MNQIIQVIPPVIKGFDYSTLDDPDLAAEAHAAAGRINNRIRTTQDEIGRELIAIQARMPHGAFGPWMAAELGFTERTATNYMGQARFVEGKSETISLLPPAALYALASRSADPDEVQKVVDDVNAGKTVTTARVEERLAQAKAAKKKASASARKSPEQIKKEQVAQEKADLAYKKKWDDIHAHEAEDKARAHAATVDGARTLVQIHTARGLLDLLQTLRDAGSNLGQVERQFIMLRMPDESKNVFISEEEIEKKFGGGSVP